MNSRPTDPETPGAGRTGLNPTQEHIASTTDREIFVAAAAGSGKTRALATRYANVVEGGGPRAADAAVAITFTDKAAGELAERIRRVLLARGDQEAARSIDAGWISTIHGLCARIVRRHAFELGIDPRATIVSDVKEGEMRAACFETVASAAAASDPEIDALLEAFGIHEVRGCVIGTLEKLRAMGATPKDVAVQEPLPDPANIVAITAAGWRKAEKAFAELTDQTQTAIDNGTACREAAEALTALDLNGPAWGEEARVLAAGFSVHSRGGKDAKDIAAWARGVASNLDRQASDVQAAPYRDAFLRLLAAYESAYESAKRERSLVDFGDLLLLTADLFTRHPEVAEEYRRRFDAVMVDEYQDTDPVQADLVERLAGARLCTVGDEQQAIYGFRFADVDVFRARRAAIGEERVSSLDVNYRSHRDIVDFANRTFSGPDFFGQEFLGLVAGRDDDGPGWAALGARASVIAIEKRGWEVPVRQVEATLVARAVVERLVAGASCGDVAILLRALTHADAYVEALRAAGVPVLVESGISATDRAEVRAIVDVLRVVANCNDDEALTSVLAGPIGGLSDAALLRLTVTARQTRSPLWDALRKTDGLCEEDAERIGRVRTLLRHLRRDRGRRSLDALVVGAIEGADLDLALSTQGPEGERTLGALFRLARLAGDLQRERGADVAEFIDHLAERERHAGRDAVVAGGAETIDAVRIMSVHAAKGLEFPFVVVPECGRGIPHDTPPILADRAVGGPRLGVKAPAVPGFDLPRGETSAWAAIRDAQRLREQAEERRILYVACTRARDVLMLCGTMRLDAEPPNAPIGWLSRALADDPAMSTLIPGGDEPKAGGWSAITPSSAGSLTVETFECVLDEAREGSRPRSVSYTTLRELELCAYRFHAIRVAGLGELGVGATHPDDAAAFGTAVHAALRFAETAPPDGARLDALARAHALSGRDRSRLQTTVERLLDSPDLARARSMPTCGVEVPFSVMLGETLLVGELDVLARDGTRALVVDHKSGPTPLDEGEESAGHSLQATCYALAALADGAHDVEVVFSHADGGRLAYEFERSDESRLRGRVEAVLARLEEPELPTPDRYVAGLCGACPAYRATCPVSGPPRER